MKLLHTFVPGAFLLGAQAIAPLELPSAAARSPEGTQAQEAQPRGAQPQDGPGVRQSVGSFGRRQEEEGPLHDFMEDLDTVVFDIEDALFAPEAAPTAEDWAQHLAQVVTLQGQCLAAKGELPRMFGRMPAEQVASQRVVYTRMMHELMQALFALEVTLMQEDRAAFRTAVKALEDLESKGHDAFKPRRRRGRGNEGNAEGGRTREGGGAEGRGPGKDGGQGEGGR
jgi:hypothetical protein